MHIEKGNKTNIAFDTTAFTIPVRPENKQILVNKICSVINMQYVPIKKETCLIITYWHKLVVINV